MDEPPQPPLLPPPPPDGCRELQCVGRLEIVRPKPVGFLCGSIPVPTDKSFRSSFNSALIPSSRPTVSAPRYRMLPAETDLNMPPLVNNFPDKVLPIGAPPPKSAGELPWDGGAMTSNLSRKGEALAVSGLVEYGDEIDVIAPADILKQIFRIPYSKARLSVAVRRVGQTIILNSGPDIEEGEQLVRRHKQSKSADQSLFLNFAMHSVRVEACDCPPSHNAPSDEKPNSSVLPGGDTSHFVGRCDDSRSEGVSYHSDYPQVKQDGFLWETKKTKKSKGRDFVKKTSQYGEIPKCSMQESEKHRRIGNDEFLRVLFWQFHNFRMLLGSDLLLFSNEKYVAVSLHLWDVTRQVTPLTWLEAWLDNVMASVPELAICYHQNGVVQGYELLKTDDIFLVKGVAEDGTPAFHPHVVQQNGLSVLRFLQENCKRDPGAYWLYKSSGEDVIQLFDLSVIPSSHSSDDCDDHSGSLSSLMHRGRNDSMFSLGTLLYRVAHRFSLSVAPNNRAKCARFIKNCLELLDEPDQLVVRACAHEQFARLLLNYDDELDLISECFPSECEITVTDAEEESLDLSGSISDSVIQDNMSSAVAEGVISEEGKGTAELASRKFVKMYLEPSVSASRNLLRADESEVEGTKNSVPDCSADENHAMCEVPSTSTEVVQTVADPVSSKLTAIHHVSQAIKSLRLMRRLQSTEPELNNYQGKSNENSHSSHNYSICACGDADCIEVCDIREWLPTSKLDHKLWKLVLLLGESYLALGKAYKETGELHQALKVVELACSVYGSMPQHLEDTTFVSSMAVCTSSETNPYDQTEKARRYFGKMEDVNSSSTADSLTLEQCSSSYLFWAKAWTLVGDVYVEFHMIKGKEIPVPDKRKPGTRELRMSSEVVKEVKRLRKKLGQNTQNCSSCSLVNCSCQSDRANSNSSASSSQGDTSPVTHGRKLGKRSHGRSSPFAPQREHGNDNIHQRVENKSPESGKHLHSRGDLTEVSDMMTGKLPPDSVEEPKSGRVQVDVGVCNDESTSISKYQTASTEMFGVKSGGIFKYLGGPAVGDAENNLFAALSCYEEATKALSGFPADPEELKSVIKKKGWVYNELGRYRLDQDDLDKAELAFLNAINAFREVSDHTNIILISCNLGHGRRALAEEMASKSKDLKLHEIFYNAYKQALETAKMEYRESLRYYGAAKSELSTVPEGSGSVSNSLRNEVYTQLAHTYLRLGMLLAQEDTTAKVYDSGALDDTFVSTRARNERTRKEIGLHEISANDAIREALSIYESLGELRRQEAAYAYFQLASYQRDRCLKFLELYQKKSKLSKCENNILQRVRQYASLAEKNWQKAIDFYGPMSHPIMYLTILMERSALLTGLSDSLHSNAMLESALCYLLEGHHVSEAISESLRLENSELHAKFWSQLQILLKKMLAGTKCASSNKTSPASLAAQTSNRTEDVGKLKELYRTSLKSTNFSQLRAMYNLWAS